MIHINVTGTEAVRQQLERLGQRLAQNALDRAANDLEDYIASQAAKHHKTGALERSLFKRRDADGSYTLGHELQVAPHALFVHWGSPPHVIKPKAEDYTSYLDIGGNRVSTPKKTRKNLRWAIGGRFTFAKQVNHPGNKPDKWMERAADLAPRLFARHVEQLLKERA